MDKYINHERITLEFLVKDGANLRGANLRGANLRGASLRGANLWGANLREANLWGADLRGANLWGANLWGANLGGANLGGANLRGANLLGADLGVATGVIHIQTNSFDMYIQADMVRIGCKSQLPDKWLDVTIEQAKDYGLPVELYEPYRQMIEIWTKYLQEQE